MDGAEQTAKPKETIEPAKSTGPIIEGQSDFKLIFGNGNVQKEAVFGHQGVVQDKVYVNAEKQVAAVADGVTFAGSRAAETADELARTLSELLAEAKKVHDNDYEAIYNFVHSEMKKLDHDIKNKYNASSTVIAGAFNNRDELILIHIGDTEGRLLRENKISHLDCLLISGNEPLYNNCEFTNPKIGHGTKFQAIHKNVPNQLGSGAFHDIRMGVYDALEGDRIILSSDGISKVLSENEIQDIVSKAQNPQEAETNLVKAACSKGLQDDYGVVVIFT